MLDRQQRDELVASLQSIKLLWEEAAGIDVVQNNIIIEILRVADDACKEGLSATRCVFYRELFQVLMDILEPQVWQNLSADEQEESKRLGLEVLNCAIDALQHEKEIKKEIVFLPYKASMWDSLESVWQAAYADKEHCNAYVVPIPYADRKPDMTVAEWHCEADMFPDYVPVLDWQEYTLEKLNAMRPDAIFIHNPYDDCNRVTSVEPQYYSRNLKQCTDKLVYIPYYVCGETTAPNMCRAPGIVNADYVIVQDENIKAQFEQHYPDGKPPEGKFLALGSPKFDKVLASKKEDFTLPESWQRIVKGKKIVLYNTSLGAALDNSDMVCKKLRYVFDVFKNRQDAALWWRPHPLMEATFRSMRPEHYAEYEQIVAEYKQAGWGIYDDTPDANRAIVCSDCYYGDDSGVLWSYRETGKPIMHENMHITSEQQQIFDVQYVCYEDNCVWFLTNEKNIVSLFCFDISKNKMNYVFSFKDEKAYRTYSYVCLAKSGNKIIMAPYQSNGEFVEYDLSTKKHQKKSLPAEFLSLQKSDGYEIFSEVVRHNESIYFISPTRMAMVEYKINTGEYICKTILAEPKDLQLSEWGVCRHGAFVVNDKLFMAMALGNKLVEYDFSSNNATVYIAPFSAEFACICCANQKFYINQYNSFDFVVFDFVNAKWQQISTNINNPSICPFNGGIALPTGMLFLPYMAHFQLMLSKNNALSAEQMPNPSWVIQYTFTAKIPAEKRAFAIKYLAAALEVYDLENGAKDSYTLMCADAGLATDIMSLKAADVKKFVIKEDMVSIISFLKYVNDVNRVAGYSANKAPLAGCKIYEILGECNV